MSDYRLLMRGTGFAARHRISVTGAKGETVVLANGFGTDQAFWRAIVPWLEQRGFRVVRFDWAIDPQHFDASRYGRVDAFAEDLLAVIHTTRAAPCRIIGHSMSGMIAMLAAAIEPGAFTHATMIAPAPRYIADADYVAGFQRHEVDALIRRMGENYMDWVEHFAPIVAGAPENHGAAGEFSRSLFKMRPDVALSMARTIFTMDLRDRLDGYLVPTTIIQPSDDPAVPVSVGEYLAARWPSAHLRVIESSGHFPQLTASDKVVAVLAEELG